jgi:hypothetical protein
MNVSFKPKIMKTIILFIITIFILTITDVIAQSHYVNPDGLCGGNLPCYTTIQAAINAAADNDVIHVAAGTYNENISFAGKNGLTLNGAQAGVSAGIGSPRNASTTAGETIINGTVTTGSGTSGWPIGLTLDGLRFENTNFVQSIRVQGDVMIANSIVHFTSTYYLISVGGNAGTEHILTLINCNLTGQRGFSIGNQRVTAALIQNNVFNTTAGSLISASSLDGVCTIKDNEFNSPRGVNLLTNNNIIAGNSFNVPAGLTNRGMDLYEVTGNTITENFFSADALSILVTSGGRGEASLDNTIENNSLLGGINNSLVSKGIDATCNWWGTESVSEISDMIDGDVLFMPWLTDGTDNEPGTPGFQPVAGSCLGYLVYNETQDLYYNTIQAAIDDSEPGDSIIIKTGNSFDESATTVGAGGLKISPGSSPGCIDVLDITYTSLDIILVDIEGLVPCTGYDQIAVTNTLTLGDATLEINLDYSPVMGDEFTIFTAGTVIGQFEQGIGPLTATFNSTTYYFHIQYDAQQVKLYSTGTLPYAIPLGNWAIIVTILLIFSFIIFRFKSLL